MSPVTLLLFWHQSQQIGLLKWNFRLLFIKAFYSSVQKVLSLTLCACQLWSGYCYGKIGVMTNSGWGKVKAAVSVISFYTCATPLFFSAALFDCSSNVFHCMLCLGSVSLGALELVAFHVPPLVPGQENPAVCGFTWQAGQPLCRVPCPDWIKSENVFFFYWMSEGRGETCYRPVTVITVGV